MLGLDSEYDYDPVWAKYVERGRPSTAPRAVKLWGTQNPHSFEGTRVVKEAAVVLAAAQTPTLAAAE